MLLRESDANNRVLTIVHVGTGFCLSESIIGKTDANNRVPTIGPVGTRNCVSALGHMNKYGRG